MYLLSWIFIGLGAGWIAGKVLKGATYGPFVDIAIGIGGAVAAGFLMQSAGFNGYAGRALTTVVAVTGAVLLTLSVGVMNGRTLASTRT